jgi:hypothetical protein
MSLRTWLVIGAGALAAATLGGGTVGRLVGAVVRELARAAL